jgi:hypothetical protein
VKINISKSGVSTSIGTNGATANVKAGRKCKATVGLPGTGISYSENIEQSANGGTCLWFWLALIVVAPVAFKLFS